MLKYQCKSCNATRDLARATIKVIDGKVRTEQAQCECGDWMQEVEKKFEGFPGIIRTDPSLSKNGVKNYQRYLRKNGRNKEANDIDENLKTV
jgi:hypothetical protein|tara:strand:+ start:334 stop:609 length:276 start_codon:yes stop_codon:yes gene_type:complete